MTTQTLYERIDVPPTKLTDEQLNQAWERRQMGWTFRQLAEEYGSWPSNMKRILERHFVQGKPFAAWPGTFTLPTDPIELGYLAGIIDGEGNIQKIVGLKSGRAWIVRVRMTDKEVIDWLGSFGGRTDCSPARSANRKPTHGWDVARRVDVLTLLQGLLAYLKVPEKRKRALRALVELGD